MLTSVEGFVVSVSHFVERHGLVVIIALGESIVVIGAAAAGLTLDGGLDGRRHVPFDALSRRDVVWLLTLALAVVGSQLAHELAYRLVTPDGAQRAHQLAGTGHAYLVYAPAALAVCSVLVLIALAGELRHLLSGRGAASSRPSALTFAVLAPAIFLPQEHFERLFHDGAFPWDACFSNPTFVVGLLLQLPLAFAAYLLARLLLGAVRSLGRLLVGPTRPAVPGRGLVRPTIPSAVPRVSVLARGYGSRGPPISFR